MTKDGSKDYQRIYCVGIVLLRFEQEIPHPRNKIVYKGAPSQKLLQRQLICNSWSFFFSTIRISRLHCNKRIEPARLAY